MRITYTVEAVCRRKTRVDGQKLTPMADGAVIPQAAAAASVAAGVGVVDAAAVAAAVAAEAAATDADDGHASGVTIGPTGGSALAQNGDAMGDGGRSADTQGIVQEGGDVAAKRGRGRREGRLMTQRDGVKAGYSARGEAGLAGEE